MKNNWLIIFIALAFFLLLTAFSCNIATPTSASPGNTPGPTEDPSCAVVTSPDGAELIHIDAGSFQMGSPATSTVEDEKPQHLVSLGCYNIYKKEVTNKMYAACVQAGVCMPIVELDEGMTSHASDPAYADYPAVGVDFNMAKDYCSWIGGRLPTEAEWEYAALARTNFVYPWGNEEPTCDNADFQGCLDPASTVKVGTLIKGESQFKVEDMAGNAWEWVFDWYAKDYYASSPSSNPVGPSTGVTKVVRGGAFTTEVDMLRSANRHGADPYMAYSNLGFRCVITTGFTLPDDYNPPNPGKHRIPHHTTNLNGNDPGDPGDQSGYKIFIPPASCPDLNGDLHVDVHFASSGPFSFDSFAVQDGADFILYTCSPYDGVNHVFHCQGGQPAPNALPNFTGKFCYQDENNDKHCIFVPFQKPTNCDSSHGMTLADVSVSCPVNGKIKADFMYSPPVVWNTYLIGNGTPMDCHPTSPATLACLAPDIITNSLYEFKLAGMGQDGLFTWYPKAQPPENCPGEKDSVKAMYFSWCDQNGALLDILFWPQDGTLDTVNVGGESLQCMEQDAGHAHCPIPDFHQGQTETGQVCVNGVCFTEDVTVPDCSALPKYAVQVKSYCDDKGTWMKITYAPAPPSPITKVAAAGNTWPCAQISATEWTCGPLGGQPGDIWDVAIEYESSPADHLTMTYPSCAATSEYKYWSILMCEQDKQYTFDSDVLPVGDAPENAITSTKMDGQLLDCDCSIFPFDCWCRNLDLKPGDAHSFEVCYKYGDCKTFQYITPDCEAEQACPCRLIDVQCLTETKFAFIVQTCPAAPEELEPGSVSAKDSHAYACDLIPTFAGRVYCAGPNPDSSAPLVLTFKHLTGMSPQQCTLTNWPPSIPACPTPVPPQKSCSDYKDAVSCRLNGCKWVIPPTGGPGSCQ